MRTGVMGMDEFGIKVIKQSDWKKPIARASVYA
jgi:hypothetical protein